MPWCPTCDRYLTPPTVRADGTCPTCGRYVESVERGTGSAPEPNGADSAKAGGEDLGPVPWHLKVLAGAAALYLGFRFFQMLEWAWRRL